MQELPELEGSPDLTLFGAHVVEGPIVLVDGRAVGGSVSCARGA